MSDAFVTFVIPTIGRDTLPRALESLQAQTDPDWRAIVIGDGLPPEAAVTKDDRITAMFQSPKLGSAGFVRNVAIDSGIKTPWTGFLDDDDTLSPRYVEWLKEWAAHDYDVVIFRMHHPKLGVLPPVQNPELRWGQVGLSFALKSEWWARGLRFVREENPDDVARALNEDIVMLKELVADGAQMVITPQIGYYVEEEEVAA